MSQANHSNQSAQLFKTAQAHIPGGVNSPVRAFKGVDGTPIFIERAKGAYLHDVDGKQYIDYIGSWGPMILGHAHPEVIEAVQRAAEHGLSYGAPTAIESEMAETLCRLVPSLEQVRMVNSGTEATMSAVRLARGYTGRNKIIKFEGSYHGHADSFLIKAGSGMLTLGEPTSPGVPADLAQHTMNLPYNHAQSLKTAFAEHGDDIACVIVEPVAGNMNCIPPREDFLHTMRSLCDEHGVVLIFDEVMTGFRVALGGAQAHYGITPDLTTLGKVIGGGMPVGAFGGKRDIMRHLAPEGAVYQAGTLSGNPVAMAAGLTTLKLIQTDNFYDTLSQKAQRLTQGMQHVTDQLGIAFNTHQVGGMFGFFFNPHQRIETFEQVQDSDMTLFKQFFHAMLERGVYLAPSAYEAGFISMAHSDDDIDQTIAAAHDALSNL